MKFNSQIDIRYCFNQHIGPTFMSADVIIGFCESNCYSFTSNAEWPSIKNDFTKSVEEGVIEGLSEAGYDIQKGIKIVLKEIVFHDVHSNPRSFFIAAKCAVKSIRELI